jgi:DNA topoisomerase-2
MFIFVNATIVNNRFTSQTKEKLSTDSKNFGTEYIVPEILLKKIFKSEIVSRILDWKRQKDEVTEKIELRKLHKNLSNIKVSNLIDCNSKIRRDCDIYLFEGNSAQSAGLKYRNPKTQAFYTLKGKVLNVNGLSNIKILQNNELKGLISSLGLELTNESIQDFRYGRILIATDYDVDGHSICGLLINFLASYWKELFQNENVYRVITPLMTLESKIGKSRKTLYSEEEFIKFSKDGISLPSISFFTNLLFLNKR